MAPERVRPKLLSGGNPQIPKADGDEPVQAYSLDQERLATWIEQACNLPGEKM